VREPEHAKNNCNNKTKAQLLPRWPHNDAQVEFLPSLEHSFSVISQNLTMIHYICRKLDSLSYIFPTLSLDLERSRQTPMWSITWTK